MYRNVAIVDKLNPNLEDLSVPLKINNCGYYQIHTGQSVRTTHPQGRNDYQLIYIANGKGEFEFKSGKRTVNKGNMVLFRPREQQIYTYYASDKADIYWVHFTGSKVENFLAHYNLSKTGNVFFAGFSPDYQWLYNQMIRELQLRRDFYDELLQILLHHILLMVNRFMWEQKNGVKDIYNEIEKAIHYFNENFIKPIKIKDYAAEHFISTNRFICNFKQVTKITPQQYIIRLRISTAKEYLASTNKSVKEISLAVGYYNVLYFSKLFKKLVGLSPTDYRANVRYKENTL